MPAISNKVLDKCVTTDGTVPAPPVDALFDVYSRSAKTYLKRRNRLLHTQYTINGEITYRYKVAVPQQNVPKCSNIPTRGSSVFKMGLVTKYEPITRHKAAFSKKKTLFTSKLDLNLRKKLIKCYIWSMALYGAET